MTRSSSMIGARVGTISNVQPFCLDPAQHLAHPLPVAAVEREVVELHARLFADLQQRQAEVEIEVEILALHLVENRPAGVQVAQLAETARSAPASRRRRRPDRPSRSSSVLRRRT